MSLSIWQAIRHRVLKTDYVWGANGPVSMGRSYDMHPIRWVAGTPYICRHRDWRLLVDDLFDWDAVTPRIKLWASVHRKDPQPGPEANPVPGPNIGYAPPQQMELFAAQNTSRAVMAPPPPPTPVETNEEQYARWLLNTRSRYSGRLGG